MKRSLSFIIPPTARCHLFFPRNPFLSLSFSRYSSIFSSTILSAEREREVLTLSEGINSISGIEDRAVPRTGRPTKQMGLPDNNVHAIRSTVEIPIDNADFLVVSGGEEGAAATRWLAVTG